MPQPSWSLVSCDSSTLKAAEVSLPSLDSLHEVVEFLELEGASVVEVMICQDFRDLSRHDKDAVANEAIEELFLVDPW